MRPESSGNSVTYAEGGHGQEADAAERCWRKKKGPLKCQSHFGSAGWPGARQPSHQLSSEAHGPVSFFATAFMAGACPWMNASRVPLMRNMWHVSASPRRTAIKHKDLRLLNFSESVATTAFAASPAPIDTDTLCIVQCCIMIQNGCFWWCEWISTGAGLGGAENQCGWGRVVVVLGCAVRFGGRLIFRK